MKFQQVIIVLVMAGLTALSGQAAIIVEADDFEHDAVGGRPFKPAVIHPDSSEKNAAVTVVDGEANKAGSGKGVRLLDNDRREPVQLAYDFTVIADTPPTELLDRAARLSAVRVDLSFAPLRTGSVKADYFRIILGEHGVDQVEGDGSFLDCRLYSEGSIDFMSDAGPDSTGHKLLAAGNTLSIVVNDHDTGSLTYAGPDNSPHTLPANAVAYWLNGSLISFDKGQEYTRLIDAVTAGGTVFTSTNNIGRLSIVSSDSETRLDYVFDDIRITNLDFNQNPVYSSWLVSNSPTGLVYKGYTNEGQENAVNKVPDFSVAGYKGGGVAIPFIPAAVTLSPSRGDNASQIQKAIDKVSKLPIGENGFRGAVLLEAGEYEVSRKLNIGASGVVIRGAGSQEQGGTRITFTSTSKDKKELSLFHVHSDESELSEIEGSRVSITDAYVPVGAKSFPVANADKFAPGDRIIVQNLFNNRWISDISMKEWGWKPNYYQQMKFLRTVTAVEGNRITIDAPVVQAIEEQYGGGEIYKYEYEGELENIGFECLRLKSAYASDTDEEHGWRAVSIENLKNGWVRQVTARHFVSSTVSISGSSKHITVEDCAMLDHKGTTKGGRRYSFTLGDACCILIQRCFTRNGRHDFASGSRTAGPNVFVDGRATRTFNDIGPHHRYSTGQLYDNLMGGEMNVQNRKGSGSGHGWSGAQIMFWNCDASSITCDAPTGAMNWVVGSRTFKYDSRRSPEEPYGIWDSLNRAVTPRSLYYAQLADRLGANALNNVILPQQKAGNIWSELFFWDGDGLFLDDVLALADEETEAKANEPLAIRGVVRNLPMLDRGATCQWGKVSGPGSVVFADEAALETTATFSEAGYYVLELTVNDENSSVANTVAVEVAEGAPANGSPKVNGEAESA